MSLLDGKGANLPREPVAAVLDTGVDTEAHPLFLNPLASFWIDSFARGMEAHPLPAPSGSFSTVDPAESDGMAGVSVGLTSLTPAAAANFRNSFSSRFRSFSFRFDASSFGRWEACISLKR